MLLFKPEAAHKVRVFWENLQVGLSDVLLKGSLKVRGRNISRLCDKLSILRRP